MRSGKEYAFYDRSAQLRQKFPMGNLIIVISCLMWLGIFLAAYYTITLSILYMRIIQDGDLDKPCRGTLKREQQENLLKLESYPTGTIGPYIVRFTPDFKQKVPEETLPVIVTAVSSAQFYQVQGLVRHLIEDIQKDYPNTKLIIYDVGLYQKEYDLLEKYCHCEVRRFISSSYPAHVADYSNFAWRPIIIQNTLNEFGSVIFLDPAARFKSSSSLKTIQNRGWRDFMVWDKPMHQELVAYTALETFEHLGEERCVFQESGMIDTEILVLFKSNKTWNLLMKPWLKCALNADCIAPSGSRYDVCFYMRHPRTTGCHRYDESALSIVLNRALQVTLERNKYIPPRMTYRAEKEEIIFPEQPWTNKQVYGLLISPIILYILAGFMCSRGKPKLW